MITEPEQPDAPADIPGVEDADVEPVPPKDPFNGIPNILGHSQDAIRRTENSLNERGQSKECGIHIASGNSWLAKRQLARTSYGGDFKHRRILGGVFGEHGNLSLRTMARIISLRAAKQAGDLVGSEPFMQAMPAKVTDPDIENLAKQTESKVQEEIAKSNMRMALAEGIRVGLTLGECPCKITWETDTTSFFDKAEVAVDRAGAPIKTPKGQFIFRKDDTIAVVINAAGDNIRRAQTDADGRPVEPLQEGEAIQIRLKKEPSFIFETEPVWQLVPDLIQTITHRDGLHCATMFTEDFIYPPNVPSLDDPACDVMVHRYDAVLETVARQYENAGYLAKHQLSANAPTSRAGMANTEAGEEQRNTATQQTITIHETYYRTWITPLEGRPFEAWLFIVIDWLAKEPIYAQYLGRMKMKKPPFFLLRGLESEPGRAYGVGIYEKFADRDFMIDCWFNRASQKSSRTASLTCAHVDGLEVVKDNQMSELKFGTDKVYRVMGGSEYGADNPPVFRINLNEMSDKEFELLERLINSGEAEFGVVDVNASQTDNARGDQVATAVRNIERTGNTLNEASEAMQAADITKALEIAVDAIFENMMPEETVLIPGEEQLATLNRDEIRNLPERDVRLLVTRAQKSDRIQIAAAATALLLEYIRLPKAEQKLVRDGYVEQLKSMDVPDADEKLREPTDEEIAAEAQASVQPQPPSVTVRLADIDVLAPSERDQFLRQFFGIQGASPEELAQLEQQKHAMKMDEASLKLLKSPNEQPTEQVA